MRKRIFTPRDVTLKRYYPVFTTVDNATHKGVTYRWGIVERLRCSIPEYIMATIKEDGYMRDDNDNMFPLTSIVKITWVLDGEITVPDMFGEYQVWVSDTQVVEATEDMG